MAGLWFEYVWDKGYTQNYEYKCCTWIVLSDEADAGKGKYVVYNNMVKRIAENEDDGREGDSEFIKFGLDWDLGGAEGTQKARATFNRVNEESEEEGA